MNDNNYETYHITWHIFTNANKSFQKIKELGEFLICFALEQILNANSPTEILCENVNGDVQDIVLGNTIFFSSHIPGFGQLSHNLIQLKKFPDFFS